MQAIYRFGAAALLAACLMSTVQAQGVSTPAERQQARAEIARERAASEKLLAENEKICYQRFAVTDCLKKVRQQANLRERELRQRELALNSQDRGERTQKQENAREKKQAEFDKKHRDSGLDSGALSTPDLEQRQREHEEQAAQRASGKRAPKNTAEQTQRREQDAAQRAAHQEKQQASKARAQQRRNQDLAEQVQDAQEDYDAKQADAARRQAAHDKRMQEREGKKQAAPLPTPQ